MEKRIVYRIAALLIIVLPVYGADMDTAVFSTKHRPIEKIIMDIQTLMSDDGRITIQTGMKAVQVVDYPRNLAAIRNLVERYDVPVKRVEVIVKLIEATRSAGNPSISDEIRDIGSRLSNVLRFTNYRLLDTVVIEGLEGGDSDVRMAGNYRLTFSLGYLSRDEDIIKLEGFSFLKKVSSEKFPDRFETLVNTSMNIYDGEEIICGASRMEQEGDKSLILVISVKTLD